MTKNLDLLTDEPSSWRLRCGSCGDEATRGDEDDKEWAKFAQAMSRLVGELQALNEPGSRVRRKKRVRLAAFTKTEEAHMPQMYWIIPVEARERRWPDNSLPGGQVVIRASRFIIRVIRITVFRRSRSGASRRRARRTAQPSDPHSRRSGSGASGGRGDSVDNELPPTQCRLSIRTI